MKIKTINRPILLLVVYGYGTWDLTLRAENWVRVFKNRVLKELFESVREKFQDGKFHSDCVHNLYSAIHQILLRLSDRGECDGRRM
jgi:hypothetical protein